MNNSFVVINCNEVERRTVNTVINRKNARNSVIDRNLIYVCVTCYKEFNSSRLISEVIELSVVADSTAVVVSLCDLKEL